MKQYRYKLSECKENEKYDERSVQGVILQKEDWFISVNKISKLEAFKNLIVEELFDPSIVEVVEPIKKVVEPVAPVEDVEETILEKEMEAVIDAEDIILNDIVEDSENPEVIAVKNMTKKELLKKIIDEKLSDLSKNKLNKLKVEELVAIVLK